MNNKAASLQAIKDIKDMMEKSSKFIGLSGLSGIAAGICALVGSYVATNAIQAYPASIIGNLTGTSHLPYAEALKVQLPIIAAFTLILAIGSAAVFTVNKMKKKSASLWTKTTRRLLVNTFVPLIAGGLFLLKMADLGYFVLIAPGCLMFYGLALVNASKYTLGEIKYLGYAQIVLALINCLFLGYGLLFWTIGFGILHILYGVIMWRKYDNV